MDLGSLFNMTDTVTLKKVERHQNLEFTSVSVGEDLLKEESVRGLLPMCCHTIEHGRWNTHKFLIENNTVRIGRRVGKADIVVDGPYIEDVQVTLQIFGGRWFVIESGIYNLLSVNGIRRRQAIVDKWSSALIQIGNIPIILSIPPKVEYDSAGNQIVTGAPETHVNGYALSSSDGQRVVLDISRTVLLGSSPSCEIRVNSEDFAAVVSSFGGSLYLCPIFNPAEFKVDGVVSQRLNPLKDGSVIEVGGSTITVAAAGSAPAEEAAQIPNMLDVEICLLEVDDQHNFGTVLKLPPQARSSTSDAARRTPSASPARTSHASTPRPRSTPPTWSSRTATAATAPTSTRRRSSARPPARATSSASATRATCSPSPPSTTSRGALARARRKASSSGLFRVQAETRFESQGAGGLTTDWLRLRGGLRRV